MHELLVPILIFSFFVATCWSIVSKSPPIETYKFFKDGELIDVLKQEESIMDRDLKNLGFLGYLIYYLKNFFKYLFLTLPWIVLIVCIYALLKIIF